MPTQLIYGIHPIREILKSGRRRCHQLYLARSHNDTDIKEILARAKASGIRVAFTQEKELSRLTRGAVHQGVVLQVDLPTVWNLSDVLAESPPHSKTIWVGLNEVTDPQNLGAILRACACLGASVVILPERRSVSLTPTVQKSASGALECVKVVSVINLNQTILELKKKGFWVYGAAVSGKPLPYTKFAGPALLLIGSEGSGLREKTAEHCDHLVSIPQAPGGVESLNASCACGILLYEIQRQWSGPSR
ncbi:MAG: 23S rRNA (guanosine(2251)-2'-O)-methyltransferase RlmB [Elusimicrobia bacterium]|nr:23S rRNA (guanosine(2251)-2'-O)-methyltransferase RlmB [Elusimicrobiota bacterium]